MTMTAKSYTNQEEIMVDPASDMEPTTTIATTSIETPQKSGVRFGGVAIREFARIMGDNPTAEGGPPLGLDWEYTDLTRNESIAKGPCDEDEEETMNAYLIPIDDYEQEAARRRRAKVMKLCKLHQKSMKKLLAQLRIIERRASNENNFLKGGDQDKDKDDSSGSDNTLSEEQMKQLSAHWLKIQPLPGQKREKILLQETDATKADIEDNQKIMRKLQQQRKSTAAMAESGLDDWQYMVEFFKRRYKRFKTGITKKMEQDLLWEQAKEYRGSSAGSSVSSYQGRSSFQSSIASYQGRSSFQSSIASYQEEPRPVSPKAA